MKLQTLTVLFIIIILPITMVVSQYIKTEISTITLQSEYDTKLNNATYDAIKAFQMNESNSTTENIPTEKIRDVNASVNSFYNSMAASMGVSGYTEEDLKGYIPCLVYTLYDGYYIYTSYDNNGKKEYGLKPYVYYTEQVKGSNVDVTVSYTLDNYIMVVGTVKGDYVAKSGYLIQTTWKQEYNLGKSTTINENEKLTENVELNGTIEELNYTYLKGENNQYNKYYYKDGVFYEYTTTGKLQEVTNANIKELLNSKIGKYGLEDNSASEYWNESEKFTKWVDNNLGDIAPYLKINGEGDENNPDYYSSRFNEHRRQVIKDSITTNLQATLTNYKGKISEFQMPELDETEWDKIMNNVSLISFMQGLPLQNKYYRGYSVVTNTQSREFVNPNEIYLIDAINYKYHRVTCNEAFSSSVAYRNISFKRKKFTVNNSENYYVNHPLKNQEWNYTSCYECIVNSLNNLKSLDECLKSGPNSKVYRTALYRERYVNYKSLNFGT